MKLNMATLSKVFQDYIDIISGFQDSGKKIKLSSFYMNYQSIAGLSEGKLSGQLTFVSIRAYFLSGQFLFLLRRNIPLVPSSRIEKTTIRRMALRETSVLESWEPNWDPPWNPSDHHSTIVFWGFRVVFIGHDALFFSLRFLRKRLGRYYPRLISFMGCNFDLKWCTERNFLPKNKAF